MHGPGAEADAPVDGPDEQEQADASAAEDRLAPSSVAARPLLMELEHRLGHPVVALYSDLMDRETATDMGDLLEEIGKSARLGLLLRSNGGDADAAHLIAAHLHDHTDELHIYVMGRAASAATLLALHAHKLWMGPRSELGPIDAQISISNAELTGDPSQAGSVRVSAGIIRDLLDSDLLVGDGRRGSDLPRELLQSIMRPLTAWRLGVLARQDKVSRLYAREALMTYLLRERDDRAERAEDVVAHLSRGYASHAAGIMRGPARRIGIPVDACPDDIWACLCKLVDLYDEALEEQDIDWLIDTPQTDRIASRPLWECPSCEHEMPARIGRFCPWCGDPMWGECLCGRTLSPEWMHCPDCGRPTTPAAS